MFCPRCGAPTEVRDARLYCTATDMDFSEVVHNELLAFVSSPPAQSDRSEVRWGGNWHCPFDATRMQENHGRLTCPACGRSLPPRLLYSLIEFHVHP
jgi:hypothetical protein